MIWLLPAGVIIGSFLLGLIVGRLVSRFAFGFALGCPLALVAPSAVVMLLFGAHYAPFGLGLWGVIPCVVGCAIGFFLFHNPET